MLIEKYNLDSWKELNSEIASLLKLNALEVQAYLGIHHALKEISIGLSQLFMHKMSIGVVAGCDYFIDLNSKDFSKLGYKVQSTAPATLKDPAAWVESLSKDTLLVMYAEDHPITGEIFETSALKNILAAKKIFSIGVSHRSQFYLPLPEKIDSFEVQVWSAGVGRSVALLGERVKISAPVAAHLNWEEFKAGSFELPVSQRSEDQAVVSAFEKNSFANGDVFFKLNEKRVYDRAVIVWRDLDAAALVEMLNADLKLSQGSLFTTSLCHWSSPKLIDWMRGNPLNEEDLRGLMIFTLEFLRLPKVVEHIKAAREKVLSLQG